MVLNNTLQFILWSSFGAISGSFMDIIISDIYHIHITKTRKYNRLINDLPIFLNKGLFMGFYMGTLRHYLKKPILDFFINKYN